MNADGKLVTDPTAVLRVWRDFYECLGREDVISDEVADSGDRAENGKMRFDDEFARQVLEKLRKAASEEVKGIPELERRIDWDEVHTVVKRSASDKAGGPDDLVYELLRNAGSALP